MFDLKITHKNDYAEIAQANPLRWRIMLLENNTLVSQSGLIKCKDFFNDVVAYKQGGLHFSMYRFDNKIKFNEEGLYVHLTEIADKELFWHNIDTLNDRIYEDLGVFLELTEVKDGYIMLIPHALWENTYRISLVTMMVRLCNYFIPYEKWEDFFDEYSPLKSVETSFTVEAIAFAKANGFTLPKNKEGYWYYAGEECNSLSANPGFYTTVIHDNGVSSWTRWMKA